MKNKKSIFFSSDWHIGHANSIVFDNRPFENLDEMHKALIKRYNAQVPVNGVCYFLGDIGVGSSETTKKVISQLNGTKILILGNHDKKMNAMYECGFDVVLYNATIPVGGEIVTMSHCPLRDVYREDVSGMRGVTGYQNWHNEHKNVNFSVTDEGQFHLHGHIHSPNKGRSKKILGRQFDVGVVANGYAPVSISTIESWIAKAVKGRECLK
jgi:calcineurin-like phosphoesterase family protein